jgi:DNA invertase Pin-like site-specific DNA recombinase
MKFGYARASTDKQDEEAQTARLKEAGCERIYVDHAVSGMRASRPEWDKLTDPENGPMRDGDVLVFVKLDRIGRSVKHLIQVAEDFQARGIDLVALDQPVDTTTAIGRMFFTILAAFAQFERDMISERTRDALAVRTARGRDGGRRQKLTAEQQEHVRKMYAETACPGCGATTADGHGADCKRNPADALTVRKYSGGDLAAIFGVSRQTIYQTVNPKRREKARKARRDRYARDEQRTDGKTPSGA